MKSLLLFACLTAVALGTAHPARSQGASESMRWLSIGENHLTIARTEEEATKLRDRESKAGDILIACRDFKLEAVGDGDAKKLDFQFRVSCVDAHFITGRGFQGKAENLIYDSGAHSLQLQHGVEIGFESDTAIDRATIAADQMSVRFDKTQVRIEGGSQFHSQLLFRPSATQPPVAPAGAYEPATVLDYNVNPFSLPKVRESAKPIPATPVRENE